MRIEERQERQQRESPGVMGNADGSGARVNDASSRLPSGLLGGFSLPRQRSRLAGLALAALAVLLALLPQGPSASALLATASQQRAVYRYDRALALYAQARAADPSDPRSACAAGAIYTLQLQSAAAVAAYQTCVALAPNDGASWLALGDALAAYRGSEAETAASAWTHAARLGSADAWARLALAGERAGQLGAATSAWAQVPPQSEQSELAAAHLGLLALARGDDASARGHLASLTHSTSALANELRDSGVFVFDLQPPVGALSWLGIGHALLTLGLPSLALAPLQRAVALAPANGSAHAYYGYTLWVLGQRDAARPQIAAGLANRPYVPFADYAAGQQALSDGQAALALAHFQRAAHIDTRNAALWSAAGDAAVATSQYTLAQLSYQNAATYSDTPEATIRLLQFYLAQGIGFDDGTAAQAAQAAAARFPTSEPLLYLQGLILKTAGQNDSAYGLFTLANQMDSTDPGPWYQLGAAAAASGDIVTASEDLNTALALQPGGFYAPQARAALAQLPANTL